MGAPKWTPGPWLTNTNDQGGAGHNAHVSVNAYDGTEVARVTCYDWNLDALPYEANAHLIAAAPEMYEALEGIREHAEQELLDIAADIQEGGIAGVELDRWNAVVDVLRKARGETS